MTTMYQNMVEFVMKSASTQHRCDSAVGVDYTSVNRWRCCRVVFGTLADMIDQKNQLNEASDSMHKV